MLTPVVEDVSHAPQDHTPCLAQDHTPPVGYAMGWFVRRKKEGLVGGREYPFVFSHTGGAVGTCSVLTVMEGGGVAKEEGCGHGSVATPSTTMTSPPRGIAVAIIFNLQGIKTDLFELGVRIAEEFYKL